MLPGRPSTTGEGSDPTGRASGTARTSSPPVGRSTPTHCRSSSCDPPPAHVSIAPPCWVQVGYSKLCLALTPESRHRCAQFLIGRPESGRVVAHLETLIIEPVQFADPFHPAHRPGFLIGPTP